MNYIDANIFIYPLINEDMRATKYKELIIKVAEGNMPACTSLLTWDEVVYIVRRYLGRNIAALEGEKFLQIPNLKLIRVDTNIIFKAQQLISQYEIKPRDAIHAATTINAGATQIISDDSDFDKIKELKRLKIK